MVLIVPKKEVYSNSNPLYSFTSRTSDVFAFLT